MAQIRAAGRPWPGARHLFVALASRYWMPRMADYIVRPGIRCYLRHSVAALVPRLPLVFHADRICGEPGCWPDSADVVFSIRSNASWLDIADNGQGFASTETPFRCNDLLANVEGIQSAGSAFLADNTLHLQMRHDRAILLP